MRLKIRTGGWSYTQKASSAERSLQPRPEETRFAPERLDLCVAELPGEEVLVEARHEREALGQAADRAPRSRGAQDVVVGGAKRLVQLAELVGIVRIEDGHRHAAVPAGSLRRGDRLAPVPADGKRVVPVLVRDRRSRRDVRLDPPRCLDARVGMLVDRARTRPRTTLWLRRERRTAVRRSRARSPVSTTTATAAQTGRSGTMGSR